jgi:hypothetical protein
MSSFRTSPNVTTPVPNFLSNLQNPRERNHPTHQPPLTILDFFMDDPSQSRSLLSPYDHQLPQTGPPHQSSERCHQENIIPMLTNLTYLEMKLPVKTEKLLAPLTNLETLHIHQYRGFILCLPSLPKLRALLENLIECEIRVVYNLGSWDKIPGFLLFSRKRF